LPSDFTIHTHCHPIFRASDGSLLLAFLPSEQAKGVPQWTGMSDFASKFDATFQTLPSLSLLDML
jgi:hypothetical protein